MKTKAQILKDNGLDIRITDQNILESVSSAMTEFADQEIAELNAKVDRIIKTANAEHETHEKQIIAFGVDLAHIKRELSDTKRRLDECQRKSMMGGHGL